MATNSIFTIDGKQCSLVKRSSSTASAARTTSNKASVTALPDLVTSGSAAISTSGTGVGVVPATETAATGSDKPTTTINAASISVDPTSTSTGNSNGTGSGQAQQHKTSDNNFSVGLIVGIILALLVSIGVAAAVWLFMRRRRRKAERQESNHEKDEKSSFNEDSEYYVVELYRSITRRIRLLRSVVLARIGRPAADDDQPADSPFSDAAATSEAHSSSPPKLPPVTHTSTFMGALPNGRPRSESFDNRDWFSTIAGPRERLVVTNPNPPTPRTATPSHLINPFADPDEPRLQPSTGKVISNPTTPRRTSVELRPRSGSYSGLNFNLPPSTSSEPFVAVQPKRRSTSPNNPYANRGPSFYPPATGPLPTFEDIQDANPFADPVPPVPTADVSTSKALHQRQDTATSSIVMLPSLSTTNSYDFTGGASRSSSHSQGSHNIAGRRSTSLGSARASSLILHAPNIRPGINFSRPPSSGSVASDSRPFGPARPSGGSRNSRDASPDNPTARTALNNTMAWKFPSKTMSGGAYIGPERVNLARSSGAGLLGLMQHGSRDTTYTARSDPFDLEERLG